MAGPYDFVLHDNPLIRDTQAPRPLCHWHAAVFSRLYQRLVHPDFQCVETECAATGAPACRFHLFRDQALAAF